MEDLISIIVPVYNAHNYLHECIDSLINQEYKNLEIILVNDGSTDDSLEICKDYAKKDSRIVLFSKANGGQASARNYALDRIHGKYVTFVDNDDWIRPNYCSELHRLAVENDSEITGCLEFNDANEKIIPVNESKIDIYTMQEFAEKLIPDIIESHMINKLFDAKIFSNNTVAGGV